MVNFRARLIKVHANCLVIKKKMSNMFQMIQFIVLSFSMVYNYILFFLYPQVK